jgi:serine/threonine protein kinase
MCVASYVFVVFPCVFSVPVCVNLIPPPSTHLHLHTHTHHPLSLSLSLSLLNSLQSVRSFYAAPSPGTFLHWALENDRSGTAKLYAPTPSADGQAPQLTDQRQAHAAQHAPPPPSSPQPVAPPSGVQSFHAAASPIHQMVGRFQVLRRLEARRNNLCEYIALEKGEHDRLYLVSEHYERSVVAWVAEGRGRPPSEARLRRVAFDVLCALDYLNRNEIVHGNLAARHLLLQRRAEGDHVLVANYGMSYITDGGRLVRFPLGSPEEMSPERVATGPDAPSSVSPQCDVWSLGIILMQLVSGRTLSGCALERGDTGAGGLARDGETRSGDGGGGSRSGGDVTPAAEGGVDVTPADGGGGTVPAGVFAQAARMCGHHLSAADLGATPDEQEAASAHSAKSFLAREGIFQGLSSSLCDVIRSCLMISPAKRPAPAELLGHPYFASLLEARTKQQRW